jgi:hypothetical protein
MKIALFYPTIDAAWSTTYGIRDGFRRMGHEVHDCTQESTFPSLTGYDLIFVSGPEYLWRKLRAAYPEWDSLPATKAGWLHEDVEREDYGTNPIAINGTLPVGDLKRFTPHLFTTAIQDQKYGLRFLPCCVDVNIFRPLNNPDNKGTGLVYMGSLYPKRKAFLEKYPEIRTRMRYEESWYANEYAEIAAESRVVLHLPTMANFNTGRVFEILATKTILLAPALKYPDGLFKHGEHLLYYEGNPLDLLDNIDEKIAERGYKEVIAKHTVEHRLEELLIAVRRPLRVPLISKKNRPLCR